MGVHWRQRRHRQLGLNSRRPPHGLPSKQIPSRRHARWLGSCDCDGTRHSGLLDYRHSFQGYTDMEFGGPELCTRSFRR